MQYKPFGLYIIISFIYLVYTHLAGSIAVDIYGASFLSQDTILTYDSMLYYYGIVKTKHMDISEFTPFM